MEILKFIFTDVVHFFGVMFFVMLLLVGITEIVEAWKQKEAKRLVNKIFEELRIAHGHHRPVISDGLLDRIKQFIKK